MSNSMQPKGPLYLARRSAHILARRGPRALLRTVRGYLQERQVAGGRPGQRYLDVLFINGCTLPHPSRYRVDHQIEQLQAHGLAAGKIFYTELKPEMAKGARLFVFFRCPYTDTIGEFVAAARRQNKPLLFDIDDLVIDEKYTNTIAYLQRLSADERAQYDDGVQRMQQLLRLCDAAITTTEALAGELEQYVEQVLLNRNVASEEMVRCCDAALRQRQAQAQAAACQRQAPARDQAHDQASAQATTCVAGKVGNTTTPDTPSRLRIGYFSGSITHNDDIIWLAPVLRDLLGACPQLELLIVGELDLPAELAAFGERVAQKPFVDFTRLPQLIASVDINIAPLTPGLFNEAKSEIKWLEAALLEVPTVASNLGAFARMIKDGETGMLASDAEQWHTALTRLINSPELRQRIGRAASEFARAHCCTLTTGGPLAEFLRRRLTANIAFVLPSTKISGGVRVALEHCRILNEAGQDAFIIVDSNQAENIRYAGREVPVLSARRCGFAGSIDKAVATLWSTVPFVLEQPSVRQRFYLVQNYETDFYEPGNPCRIDAEKTYTAELPLQYLTISRWCQDWLKQRYGKLARYAPNGINTAQFAAATRSWPAAGAGQRVRVLVEGNSSDRYKNVDGAFRVIEQLDTARFEVWYMSYDGRPKPWYRVDRFLHKVPLEQVGEVYAQCDILLKSSLLESFSYPPLEMMATGGWAVVAANAGNAEYLRDGENCLLYDAAQPEDAVAAIERVCADAELRAHLAANGLDTARARDWAGLAEQIVDFYGS
ncbi:MAG: glycosyltransferase family 4 protein [Coriobacteriales bacterium]|jgi:glycosyltransferase involved in cell wall biosynthesis|nr:glycosyltransferase family 4 protein [Coriobacteriales bacterium]